MLKILQARLQQYMNRELPDVQAGFTKGRGIEIKLPISVRLSKKQESSSRTSISALLTLPKPLTVQITINCEKFWKRWEYQTTWPASWDICMQVKKQHNWTWNNRLVPNWERRISRLYKSPCLFNFYAEYIRRRQWHLTPVLLPGKSHRRRSLVGCSPWGR